MILSVNGGLAIFAAYANILTIATYLGVATTTTQQYAKHPAVRLLLLYVFAYSVIKDKLACLFAVALFTVVEVREFVTKEIQAAGDEQAVEAPADAAIEDAAPGDAAGVDDNNV